jgi:hypothetical protein
MRANPQMDGFWPEPQCPILFCHVIGKEGDHKTGSKTTGGKKIGVDSKFNETEATKVVRNIKHRECIIMGANELPFGWLIGFCKY